MLVAYSDDGTLWDIDASDAILRNLRSVNGFYEYPTIAWDSVEQLGGGCIISLFHQGVQPFGNRRCAAFARLNVPMRNCDMQKKLLFFTD